MHDNKIIKIIGKSNRIQLDIQLFGMITQIILNRIYKNMM